MRTYTIYLLDLEVAKVRAKSKQDALKKYFEGRNIWNKNQYTAKE